MKIFTTALLAFAVSFLTVVEGKLWASFHGIGRYVLRDKIDGYITLDWRPTYLSGFAMSNGTGIFNAVFDSPPRYPGWHVYWDNSIDNYRKALKERKEAGYRLLQVNVYSAFGERYFTTRWEQNYDNIPWAELTNQSRDEFMKSLKEYEGKGYRLKSLSGYGFNGEQQFASVWEQKSSLPWRAYAGLTAAEYQAKFNEARKDGYYPVQISPYNVGTQVWFAGIFEKVDSKAAKPECQWALTSDQYVKVFNDWRSKGYMPTVVEGYLNGGERYAAIFNKITETQVSN
ncbi:uncharacterized protein GIQ15_05116 [Arthroderma uncinatum]|uniref:uncharacterized protein n=1 Tax=Arthroderma uncinatum TaxID=74035 RepID=UPI00144ABF2C|nr:uncharacterized protein GIQ15_05116 [Arthroderma uncinatum]KAF3482357.1 hypothetical protein GIQ15_05116 [Arthroderma uncinatum]